MRFSFMTFSCPDLELDEVLALATRAGYDGIEPRIVSDHKHGIEVETDANARESVRRQVEAGGITLGCIATSCMYADPATNAENLEMTRKCIDLAADVGAPSIRVFGGRLGEGLGRDEAIALLAGSFEKVVDQAERRGVTICMETHDDWCDPQHVAEVLRRVDHPAICVNWDIMHPVRTGKASIDEAFQALRPWIRHVHVHDAKRKDTSPSGQELTPIGTGYVDHRRAIELLGSIDYEGCVSGEWINWPDPYEEHLPRELATLKRYRKETLG